MGTMRRLRAPLMLLVALGAAATAASAAELKAKSWEAGVAYILTNYDNDSTLDDAMSFGVRGAYVGTPRHEGEFYFTMQSADSLVNDDETIDISRFSLRYIYNLKVKKPESKLVPFLMFGAGTMSYEGDAGSDSTTTLEVGGGVRVFMTKRFALRFDGSIFHMHGDSEILPRDGWFAFDFTAGVSWTFGGA